MATTAWKSAGTLSSQTRSGGSVSWVNPSNAGASDNSYATAAVTDAAASHWLWATNFGFTTTDIPSGSTINGIEVEIERKASYGLMSEGATENSLYKLIKSSAETGTQKTVAGALPASDTVTTQGGASDMWGATISDTDARASTTGWSFAYIDDMYTTSSVSVDQVRMRYHYTAGSSFNAKMSSAFCTFLSVLNLLFP